LLTSNIKSLVLVPAGIDSSHTGDHNINVVDVLHQQPGDLS